MMEVVDLKPELRDKWTAYVDDREDATICHRIEWHDIISATLGHKPRYLIAIDGDRVRGVLPMFQVSTWWRSRYMVSIPWLDYGGVLADDSVTGEALLERASEHGRSCGAKFVEMRSMWANLDSTAKRMDKVTFVLDMSPGKDEIWKGFNAKLRNQIRKPEKAGLTTEFGRQELLDDFYEVFAVNMRDLGTPVWGKNLFARVLADLPNNSELVIVRRGGRAIAGGLVLAHKDLLYVPSASSYRSERSSCPNHALYWQTIKRGMERGYKRFDFGRSTIDGPTYRFKKQWTPDPVQLTWQYQLIKAREVPALNPDNENFSLAIKIWQKLPLPVANLLGPRVIKNFP
jgi:FemAB-related protein (PEP-CTERM system-associated)